MRRRVRWFSASCALLLAGCWSHYGVALDVIPSARSERVQEVQAGEITDSDLEKAKSIVTGLAVRHQMDRSEASIPGNGFVLVVSYAGPYSAAAERASHPAGGLELSLWVRDDRSSLSVWIVDWRGVGVTDRLEKLRDEALAAVEAEFPRYSIKIEEQKLGVFAP